MDYFFEDNWLSNDKCYEGLHVIFLRNRLQQDKYGFQIHSRC